MNGLTKSSHLAKASCFPKIPTIKASSLFTKGIGVIASTGLTQIVGLSGLTILGLKNIVNTVAMQYFHYRLWSAKKGTDTSLQDYYTKKIEAIHISRVQDKQTSKAMGLLLVPLAGASLAYHYGDLMGGLSSAVNDVLSVVGLDNAFDLKNLVKSGAYPLSGIRISLRKSSLHPIIKTFI